MVPWREESVLIRDQCVEKRACDCDDDVEYRISILVVKIGLFRDQSAMPRSDVQTNGQGVS
jgi:hypothetical protein